MLGKINQKGEKRSLRIAYFSPIPPERSGIADYSRELLPYLSQQAEITIYAPFPMQIDEKLRERFTIRDLGSFPRDRFHYDFPLYQMGNSAYHDPYYPFMTRYPGIVVLHDYFIHHFIAHRTIGTGDFAGYSRELGYALGAEGLHLAHLVRLGIEAPRVFDIPLNNRLLDTSLGILVHSSYVAEKLRQQGYGGFLQIVPALIQPRDGRSKKDELGLPPDSLLFASFGLITSSKHIEMALRSFKKLLEQYPNAHYLLVGDVLPDVPLEDVIRALDLSRKVHRLGFAPDLDEFVDWIYTADIVLNLRYPTVGETSASALRAMAAGRPLIVFDVGWYREIPDQAAIKTLPLDEEGLLEGMSRLAGSPDLRRQMGEAGKQYTVTVCHPTAVASKYIAAIEQILAGCGVSDG